MHPRLPTRIAASLAALTLASCGSSQEAEEGGDPNPAPVPESDVTLPGNTTLGPQGEATQLPAAEWVYKEDQQMAVFGPPNSEGLLTVHCRDGEIVVTRHSPAEEGGTAMLNFSGDAHTASLAVRAEPMELGPEFVWQGTVSRQSDDLRQVFEDNLEAVTVSAGLGDPLRVPLSDAPVKAIDACRR